MKKLKSQFLTLWYIFLIYWWPQRSKCYKIPLTLETINYFYLLYQHLNILETICVCAIMRITDIFHSKSVFWLKMSHTLFKKINIYTLFYDTIILVFFPFSFLIHARFTVKFRICRRILNFTVNLAVKTCPPILIEPLLEVISGGLVTNLYIQARTTNPQI